MRGRNNRDSGGITPTGDPINSGGGIDNSGGSTSGGGTDQGGTNTGGNFDGIGGDPIGNRPTGGTSTGTGGGGGTQTMGCTQKGALNYDPTATIPDDASCIFSDDFDYFTSNTESTRIRFSIKSTPSDAAILIDDIESKIPGGVTTPGSLTYSIQELLTPKIIKVQKANFVSNGYYRISVEKKKKPLYSFGFDDQFDRRNSDTSSTSVVAVINYYLLIVEKREGNRWTIQRVSGYNPDAQVNNVDVLAIDKIVKQFELPRSVDLPFDLVESDYVTKQITLNNTVSVITTNPLPDGIIVNYQLKGFDVSDDTRGRISSGINRIRWSSDLHKSIFVYFESVNTNSYATRFSLPPTTYQGPPTFIEGTDYELDLEVNEQSIGVLIERINNPIKQPVLYFDFPNPDNQALINSNFVNLANIDEVFKIPYRTENAELVRFTIGNTTREYPANGSIVLTVDDFYDGVGTYLVYLQPYSSVAGYGETKKLVINAQFRKVTPGPDIITIFYPLTIKGADFKGYNVEFSLNWNAINTNYTEVYVTKKSNETIIGKINATSILPNEFVSKNNSGIGGTPTKLDIHKRTNTILQLNVADVLQKAGIELDKYTDVTQFDLVLIPVNTEGDVLVYGVEEKITITFDKGNELRRNTVIDLLSTGFFGEADFGVFDNAISRYLTHIAHFGSGDNKLIANWDIDKETYSIYEEETDNPATIEIEVGRKLIELRPTLILKMYEPLPKDITPNQLLWISKIQSITYIEEVRIIDEEIVEAIPLRPNKNAEITDDLGYSLYDSIITEGSLAGEKLVNKYIDQSGFTLQNLGIDYLKEVKFLDDTGILYPVSFDYYWENFVKYSSAKERLDNFFYKVKMLEAYNSKLEDLNDIPNDLNSLEATIEKNRISNNIKKIQTDFDGFERFLTETTDTTLAYPGAGGMELSASVSQEAYSWYVTASLSAEEFDDNNPSNIIRNLPEHIKISENDDYILFFNMIGQHFDLIWSYINGLTKNKIVEHKQEFGIYDELIPYMLESLGWDLERDVDSQTLWEYAFGFLDKDGIAKSSMSGADRQNEVWRRLLNNLPYIYKNKGTRRAIDAVLACYGVPASTLTFFEYGGPTDPTDTFVVFSYDEKSSALKFTGKESIKIPWKEYPINNDYANTVELRFNTSVFRNHIIAQTDNTWRIGLVPGTGSVLQAKVEFTIESGGVDVSMSTEYLPLFNDNYYYTAVTKEIVDNKEQYKLYVKEAFQQRVRNYDVVSMSLDIGSTSWKSGSNLEIGSGALGTFIGNVDEIRLWTTALSESVLINHTLAADAIDGNSYSASTADLFFRLDFEYPKNRAEDTDILNVATNQSYVEPYATAVGFDSVTDYPYNYEVYERETTVKVPSTGLSYANKIKIQDQKLISDLSYKSRATKRMVDTSHSDSEKIGMFLSPVREINMDIIKSLGEFNIDNYLGNPADEYEDRYKDLDQLRNYYFGRYDLRIYEYIQLVRYIDKSLFEILKTVTPARSKVATGLLFEPHILQRSKVDIKKPLGENPYYESNQIDFKNDLVFDIDYDNINAELKEEEVITFGFDYNNLDTNIENIVEETIVGEPANYDAIIDEELYYDTQGDIIKSKNSDTAAIHIDVDANMAQEIISQFENDKFTTAGGFSYEDTAVGGFRFWGVAAHTILTEIDSKGQITKRRMRAYRLKQKYTVETPTPDGTIIEEKFRYKITLLPIEFGVQYILKYIDFYEERMILNIGGNDVEFGIGDVDLEVGVWKLTYPYLSSNPDDTEEYQLISLDMIDGTIAFTTSLFGFGAPVNIRPEIKNEVVAVEDLAGSFRDYVYNHDDKPTGIQRSFDIGSKQTDATTPDGGPAVVTFTTNPNTLRVNQSGRGSGEPILEVD
jgi:hypothetical protein